MTSPTDKGRVRLDTDDQIRACGGYIIALRDALAAGHPLTLDEQREALDIAYAALLIARPAAPVNTTIWVDAGERSGPIPDWLKQLQDEEST